MIRTPWVKIHNAVAQFAKLSSLKWFGEEISQHVCCRTMLNGYLTRVNHVLNAKEARIHVSCAFGA
jgi:hypothetical protein